MPTRDLAGKLRDRVRDTWGQEICSSWGFQSDTFLSDGIIDKFIDEKSLSWLMSELSQVLSDEQ